MNPLKKKLQAGEPILGFMVTIPNVQLVAILARTGADWIMIDMEHGPIGIATVQDMIAATNGTGCTPVVRVPKIDPTTVKPVLDAGAFGIVFPMVLTGDQARVAVESMRYPPAGVRGIGPIHAAVRWGLTMAEYIERANDELVTIALIEDIRSVENIDAILATPGIDVAQIAPFDFSASLGVPGQLEHPDVVKAIATAEEKILASDKVLGGLGQTAEKTNAMIGKGYRWFVLTHDAGLIQSAAAGFLDHIER